MLKKLFSLFIAAAVLFTFAARAEVASPTLQRDLVILFTSDVHCGIDQNWGMAGLYAVRRALEAEGKYTLLVDNGDFIQGEAVGVMTQGGALIDVMNAAGYDIAVPGNHEFDYGVERFLALAGNARFPYISANFEKNGDPVFDPYVIREFDGVKIAFVGVCTPRTLISSTPRYFMDDEGNWVYGFMQDENGEKLYACVQKAVDDARAEGAEHVILLAHLGNAAGVSPYRYDDLITHIRGVDALLDGHSHDLDYAEVKDKDGRIVLRQGCGTKMEAIGALTISAAGGLSMKLYRWDLGDLSASDLGISNAAGDAVSGVLDELNGQLSEVVGRTDFDLVIYEPGVTDENGNPIRIVHRAECNMGDLCADAFRSVSGAEIGWVNSGSIRTGLKAGPITMDDLLSVQPFGNVMCVEKVAGRHVLDALEWNCRAVPGEGNFLQVSGITFEIHTYIPSSVTWDDEGMFTGVAGEYRVKNVKVNGEDLDPDREYTLASNSYILLNNGDGSTMYNDAQLIVENGMPDVQVLFSYITGTLGGVIPGEYASPHGQGRIVAVEEAPEE